MRHMLVFALFFFFFFLAAHSFSGAPVYLLAAGDSASRDTQGGRLLLL